MVKTRCKNLFPPSHLTLTGPVFRSAYVLHRFFKTWRIIWFKWSPHASITRGSSRAGTVPTRGKSLVPRTTIALSSCMKKRGTSSTSSKNDAKVPLVWKNQSETHLISLSGRCRLTAWLGGGAAPAPAGTGPPLPNHHNPPHPGVRSSPVPWEGAFKRRSPGNHGRTYREQAQSKSFMN